MKLSYQFDEFMKYQSLNNVLPQQLVSYCVQDVVGSSYNMPNIAMFTDQLNTIIASITKGDNPNDVVFKNFVKFYINTIHQGNYDDFLEKLKSLEYTTNENIHFLSSELIICAMRCPMSVKGFTIQENSNIKSIPEICADIAQYFSTHIVKSDTCPVGFNDEMLKLCKTYFMDFVDLHKSMDENNENTSDNYKGFMTFMGLLYSKGFINIKIVIDCLDSIRKTIFCAESADTSFTENHNCPVIGSKLSGYGKNITSKIMNTVCYHDCNESIEPSEDYLQTTIRKQIECINLYKGYEHLLTHVIQSLDVKLDNVIAKNSGTAASIGKLNESLNIVCGIHKSITTLNKCYKSLNKNQLVAPLRPYVMITHNNLDTKLDNLKKKIATNFSF